MENKKPTDSSSDNSWLDDILATPQTGDEIKADENGNVTALKAGTVMVSATSEDGNHSATVRITVKTIATTNDVITPFFISLISSSVSIVLM